MTKRNGQKDKKLNEIASKIANLAVPEYATGKYPCHGVYAKRWDAAYNACLMVTKEYENRLKSLGIRGVDINA